jgi:serine/threonine-protein kinase
MNSYIGMKLDGRYELLELIGSGGMAEIYRATDTVEDRTVAVKILKNEFAGSDDFLRRFRNESKAIALLSHPNIVKIFDVGFTDSIRFIVMEYVDGITLTEYISRQGVLKWKEAHSYISQILKALQHAHDRGIVHRDVKSQNVMLLRDGSIKVMDFGIARFNREIDKTMSEKAIGSVHYISPEQARGENTDEKSDLYSVGIMLYEMLTGVKPFDGDDALKIAMMHTNKQPKSPREINSSIPGGLEEIILRAMQKNTAERYQSSLEMLVDLQEFEKNPYIVFEYKYATPAGEPKHIDKAGKPAAPPNPSVAPVAVANSPNPTNSSAAPNAKKSAGAVTPEFDEDDDEYDEDEIEQRRSPLLPILFAVASAFVIFSAFLITYVATEMLNRGNNNRTMPDLRNRTVAEVNADYSWLKLEVTQEYSAEFALGHIIRQSERPGALINPAHVVVDVVVSQGERRVTMPDFLSRNHTEAEVVHELQRLGLNFIPHRNTNEDGVPAGIVYRTDARPGDLLAVGETVRFWVSLGSTEDQFWVQVIDFTGMVQLEAEAEARRIDLLVANNHEFEESDEAMRGRVIGQSIVLGDRVPRRSVIQFTIGTGPSAGRYADIQFAMPEIATGSFEFELFRGSARVDSQTHNMALGRIIRFEFKDVGVQTYSVLIRQGDREGIYATYTIDFEQEPPEILHYELDVDVLLAIIPPPTPSTTPVNTTTPPVSDTSPHVTETSAPSTTDTVPESS